MKNRFKNYAQTANLFWYAVPPIAGQVISFLMLSLYTRVLQPQEYGSITLAVTFASTMALVLMLNMQGIYFRQTVQVHSGKEIALILSPLVKIHLFVVFVLFPVLLPFVLKVSPTFIPGVPKTLLLLAAINVGLSSLRAPLFADLRAHNRVHRLAVLQLAALILETSITAMGLLVWQWGAVSLLIGSLVVTACWLPFSLPYLVRGLFESVTQHQLLQAAKSCATVVPEMAAVWAVTAVDRMVLNYFRGPSDVAIYGAAFQFGSILAAIAIICNKQWQALIYRAVAKDNDAVSKIRSLFESSLGIFLLFAAILCLAADPFTQFFLGEKFHSAAQWIPWTILVSFLRIPEFFLSNVFWAKLQRRKLVFYNALSLSVFIVGCLLLIPGFGIWGAIAAHAVSRLGFLIAIVVASPELWVHWGPLAQFAALALLVIFAKVSDVPMFLYGLMGLLSLIAIPYLQRFIRSMEAFSYSGT